MLSVLIPIYNDTCFELVRGLHTQAEQVLSEYEIIVADDGSDDEQAKKVNRQIDTLSHCKYIINDTNRGRAGIRNFLADVSQGEWLLFIDGDMHLHKPDFLKVFAEFAKEHKGESCAVCGGYEIKSDDGRWKGNLRYKYEVKSRYICSLEYRNAHPDRDFKTANVMMHRSVFDNVRFDENMRNYGYEDTLFGRNMKLTGIPIHQIDNPVLFDRFDDNKSYLHKTEEAVANVVQYESLLFDYSRLLQTVNRIQRWHLHKPMKLIWMILQKPMRANLEGNNPSIMIFNIYKTLLANRLQGNSKSQSQNN